MELPYAPAVRAKVFANRSDNRPTPVGITVVPRIEVDEGSGTVVLARIDAFDGLPNSMESAAECFADPDNLARLS